MWNYVMSKDYYKRDKCVQPRGHESKMGDFTLRKYGSLYGLHIRQ